MQAVALAAFAAEPPLRDFCETFHGETCQVIWEAPSNQIPASVKILKVVPTKFSPAAISNLLQIVGLIQKDKMRLARDGVLGGKDVLTYANKEDTRHLDIIPSQGAIGLTTDGAFAKIPKEMPTGVPDDKEAFNLALNMLEKIGISRLELATNADGNPHSTFSEGSVVHKDKSTGRIITNIVDRTIILNRQIDGVPVWGTAGISMKFGNEGKLAYLETTWRAIKPDKDCRVPSASEFVQRIRSSRVLIRSEQVNANYKKLIITKAALYYWESSASEPQSYIYPFAVLDAKTDLQGENSNVQLFVPFANE
jgi:hypothetical protein